MSSAVGRGVEGYDLPCIYCWRGIPLFVPRLNGMPCQGDAVVKGFSRDHRGFVVLSTFGEHGALPCALAALAWQPAAVEGLRV
jgi:hypothetical protein